VRILTNSLASNDVGIVHSGYSKYRKALLRGGVELYELNKKLSRRQRKEKKGVGGSSKASLHAKSFVFDRRQVFIGSLNLDPLIWLTVVKRKKNFLPTVFQRSLSVVKFQGIQRGGTVLRRLITLIFAGWLPHDLASSRSCLGLGSGVRP
jgi:hypothetical protein